MTNPVVERLVGRSNRLGADPKNTNYAGGNTSAKRRDPVDRHRDAHLHPDSGIAIATASDGESLTKEIFGEKVVWVPWRRPGFQRGLDIAETKRANTALVRSIVESLAQAYADALDTAQALSGHRIGVVHLVGGGALNELLCRTVADRSGRPVLAGPVEATALGNVLVQGRAAGAVRGSLEALRSLVADTQDVARFEPRSEGARSGR